MISQAANGIIRGYARNKNDEARLRAAGVKTIYRADKGEELGKFKMRKGETLGVVDGLLAFGEAKADMVGAVRMVHGWGATIRDAETGKTSRDDGAEMMAAALGPKRPSSSYREAQAKAAKSRVKGRMPDRPAQAIWFDAKMSVVEKLDLMTGWSRHAAYAKFGKTGIVSGRRPREQ